MPIVVWRASHNTGTSTGPNRSDNPSSTVESRHDGSSGTVLSRRIDDDFLTKPTDDIFKEPLGVSNLFEEEAVERILDSIELGRKRSRSPSQEMLSASTAQARTREDSPAHKKRPRFSETQDMQNVETIRREDTTDSSSLDDLYVNDDAFIVPAFSNPPTMNDDAVTLNDLAHRPHSSVSNEEFIGPGKEDDNTAISDFATQDKGSRSASASAGGSTSSEEPLREFMTLSGKQVVGPIAPSDSSNTSEPRTPVTEVTNAVGEIALASENDTIAQGIEALQPVLKYEVVCKYARDIPHDLLDEVNSIPAWCRNPELLRQIFESSIITNTMHDEPDAPYIRVINNVDDDPTPPFEFYYTNLLWHGDGVPDPDHESLLGCDCIGVCDSRSRTCACIKRQREAYKRAEFNKNGFIYDDKGRLRDNRIPIFECNDACRCTDDCKNRVN